MNSMKGCRWDNLSAEQVFRLLRWVQLFPGYVCFKITSDESKKKYKSPLGNKKNFYT